MQNTAGQVHTSEHTHTSIQNTSFVLSHLEGFSPVFLHGAILRLAEVDSGGVLRSGG